MQQKIDELDVNNNKRDKLKNFLLAFYIFYCLS
jgi:hypothetical protein